MPKWPRNGKNGQILPSFPFDQMGFATLPYGTQKEIALNLLTSFIKTGQNYTYSEVLMNNSRK